MSIRLFLDKNTKTQKRIVFSVICSFLFIFNSFVYSQEPDSITTFYGFNRAYIASGYHDAVDAVTSPAYWITEQWQTFGFACGGGLIAYTFDEDICILFNSNQNDFIGKTSKYFFEPLGSGLLSFPIMGTFYLVSKSKKDKLTCLNSLKAFVVSRVLVQFPKYMFCRHSPSDTKPLNSKLWQGPGGGIYYDSFPSGHTASIFAMATVISESYKDKKWVPITSYGIATLSSLSRLYDNKHWFSDIVAGALIGYGVGKLTFNKHLKINPVVFDQGETGVQFVKSF